MATQSCRPSSIIAIQCPSPVDLVNTDREIVGVHFNHTVSYTCMDGYATAEDTLSPNHEVQTMTCQAGGTWDITPIACSHSEC